jgi:hypothetical protein
VQGASRLRLLIRGGPGAGRARRFPVVRVRRASGCRSLEYGHDQHCGQADVARHGGVASAALDRLQLRCHRRVADTRRGRPTDCASSPYRQNRSPASRWLSERSAAAAAGSRIWFPVSNARPSGTGSLRSPWSATPGDWLHPFPAARPAAPAGNRCGQGLKRRSTRQQGIERHDGDAHRAQTRPSGH